MSKVFANGPIDLGSIPGCVIPVTFKMVLDTFLFNTQQYKVGIKGKVEQSGKGVAPFPIPVCSSYRKGGLLVANLLLWVKSMANMLDSDILVCEIELQTCYHIYSWTQGKGMIPLISQIFIK